jgi:hypothetical protein
MSKSAGKLYLYAKERKLLIKVLDKIIKGETLKLTERQVKLLSILKEDLTIDWH